jgi:hypothetical protein
VVRDAGEAEMVFAVGLFFFLFLDTGASMRPQIMTTGSSVSILPAILSHMFKEHGPLPRIAVRRDDRV